MEDLLLIVLLAVVVIAVTTVLGQRLGVAGPLLLVALGIGVALLPFVHVPEINPEWILVGVLPPLLYSAAVNLPAIEFRRDFGPIAGLSVLLVVLSSVVLGLFFWMAVPSVGLPLGIALGAILSPTDAVATSIVKKLGITPRVVTMLEGESLLNDATALVLLRTAIVAIAGGFSFGATVGNFVWAVLLALVVGAIVGYLTLRLRAWVGNSAANTAISFTVPFIAYLPTEHFGGSGLVAAVVAGIVTGQGAARWLTPEQRMSDTLNWRTIELVLEGGVFLVMGLELKDIVGENIRSEAGLWHGAWLALSALAIVLAVRAVYVTFLVLAQSRRARRMSRERLEQFGARIDAVDRSPAEAKLRGPQDPARRARRLDSMRSRVSRALADLDYYQASPLGWKHGTIIVWAGMRGVVTLAAAQTLPRDGSIDSRALLVFVAFLVAVGSLMLQGFTLPWVVRALKLEREGEDGESREEQSRLDEQLRVAAASALQKPSLTKRNGEAFDPALLERIGARMTQPPDDENSAVAKDALELRLVMIEAMRGRLNELSHGGTFSTVALRHALAELDADELSLQLRLREDD
ncbi:sodium:proton antiporter [Microbacterium sp. Root61]|uniref:cation:proton antiporter n=1 Tax=Microbacterium sp. Root61 TaxID=1736570 RepID=UPI000700E75C|nr:sodium:proton antiporter [Microbacterium sp. Root61]KRA25014.1 sodium:proton antiporter [Microbacterium sp. Root61]